MAAAPRPFRTQNIPWQARLQGVPLASFRARVAAFLIDGAAVVALLLVPGLVAMWQAPDGTPLRLSFQVGGLASLAVAVAWFGVGTWAGRGRTPGKWLLGIRVVSLVHDHLTLWHCIERTLGYAASSLEAGFGFVQYFTHANHQTVHDRIAETIVIASPRRGPLPRATP